MSIASQISRLQADSADIASAISAKGVTVPSGSGYDDYASLIASIPSGGGATLKMEATSAVGSGSTTITFSDLKGEPVAFFLEIMGANASYINGANPKIVTSVLCDGTTVHSASIYKSGSTAREYYYNSSTFTYSNGTLIVNTGNTANAGVFRSGNYRMIYFYNS